MPDPLDTSDRAKLSPREVADRFIEVFYRQNRLVEAFRAWVHPDYIQHDPNSATGRDGTIAALEAHKQRSPGMSHDIKRVIYGEDGTIAVHYHFRHAPDQRGLAVVDLFRIADGYLVEHWDIIQPIPDPETVKNNNGMF
ncbi:MAG TPA: nuclear transport factor 2 family protein [Croceibacterium sp.]|nr:nuclear transport factor 2 family protein [Croceibacterium sp.]